MVKLSIIYLKITHTIYRGDGMRIYIARRGDSLYSIARANGVTVRTLAELNELSDPARLSVGQAIVIPDMSRPVSETEVNGYAYPNISAERLGAVLPQLTYLCPFSWQIDETGGITPVDDEGMISAAWENGCAPLLTLTNLGVNGGFSSGIAHSIFTDAAAQDTLVRNTLSVLESRGYYGVNLNIEYVQPYDREGYNAFLKRMSETLHSSGYMLSSAVAPKSADDQHGVLYTAHDYAFHGQYCDRVVIMTYEWGYTYSAPRAISPVNEMRRVIAYAVTKMPPSKILLGFSNYGYDWTLPWKQGQAARVISNAAAVNLAASVYAQIKLDETAQAPFFNYTDPAGVRHEVWFEDARSVRARLALVREYGLAGISIWTVNMRNRAGLSVLESEFSTEKIV
jgi:spore germination protein